MNERMPLFGDNPQYMTMEVSGLPPASAGTFARLKSAHDAFQSFFGDKTPEAAYDFTIRPFRYGWRDRCFSI
jgi:hypothetical protein